MSDRGGKRKPITGLHVWCERCTYAKAATQNRKGSIIAVTLEFSPFGVIISVSIAVHSIDLLN